MKSGARTLTVPAIDRPKLEELVARVEVLPSGCWQWNGKRDEDDYGLIWIRHIKYRAHRVFYTHYRGAIASGHELDHLCRHRPCVNPDHLESVTPGENSRRKYRSLYGNACAQGHEITPESTAYSKSTGWRFCRVCKRERAAATYARDPQKIRDRRARAYRKSKENK